MKFILKLSLCFNLFPLWDCKGGELWSNLKIQIEIFHKKISN
ncbi:hypothetical protein A33Q_0769 [Indibacter alkaliphilus LW1]|uniref:Uncharacterized protein n=1 Tax=Indibacter alkaliphilus (strain CCUG 57479 / KCTC 22604 / LW1) TaxID=1189612 RepID=S2E3R6_INDAL|nr:hypothetical protein A33Q_0769 [Indibacter alkaliphilus LW1]